MRQVLAVGAGGAIGTALRYLVESIAPSLGAQIAAALAVNLAGAYLIGLVTELLFERLHSSGTFRLFLTTGILGGFTTFGTFTGQVALLAGLGAAGQATLLGIGAPVLGILGTMLGYGTGQMLSRRP